MTAHRAHAREFHLNFASVGSGVLLGIALVRVEGVIKGTATISTLAVLHLATWLPLFWRLYWIYFNVLGRLWPISSAFEWGSDMLCFLIGGAMIASLDRAPVFIAMLAVVQAGCLLRVRAVRRQLQMPGTVPIEPFATFWSRWSRWLRLFEVGMLLITAAFVLSLFCPDSLVPSALTLFVAVVQAFSWIEPLLPVDINADFAVATRVD